MITHKFTSRLALGAALFFGAGSYAHAQDSGPLIDALVRKGILTDQEGEELRADLLRDFGGSSAGKFDVAPTITRLRLSGDARVRYQYDNEQPNKVGGAADPSRTANDRDRHRYRYRLRFGVLADLGPKWSAAFRLESANGATSTNADLGSATDNFSKETDFAYFGQVYLNYRDSGLLGTDAVDLRMGKLPHKFFTPGVNGFWIDSDLNFEGLAEELVYQDVGLSGSTLALRAGQFVLNNNAANAAAGGPGAGNRDVDPSLLLMTQVEYGTKTWKVAPAFVGFAAPSRHDRGAVTPAAQASDTAVYTDLATLLVPFEYGFTVGGKPLALYATYAHNFDGEARARRLSGGAAPQPVDAESDLYNLGLRYGENKFAGDYQLVTEYRYVGNGSYTSILLDSDFNGGLLNGEGFILSGSYSLTSAITGTLTYFNSFNIEETRPAGTARGNGFGHAQVLQVDLSARF